jgi:hypothetical protein
VRAPAAVEADAVLRNCKASVGPCVRLLMRRAAVAGPNAVYEGRRSAGYLPTADAYLLLQLGTCSTQTYVVLDDLAARPLRILAAVWVAAKIPSRDERPTEARSRE